jgi:hypothetical protein
LEASPQRFDVPLLAQATAFWLIRLLLRESRISLIGMHAAIQNFAFLRERSDTPP